MKFTLNLASRSYVNRKVLYVSYGLVGILLLVVLLINLMTLFDLQTSTTDTREKLAELQTNAASQDADMSGYSAQALANLGKSIDAANDVLRRDSFRWTELLDRFETLMPSRVRIRSITPNYTKQTIAIACEAKDLTAMKRFIDKLNQSGYYRQVLLSQQTLDTKTAIIKFDIELIGGF